MGFIAKSVGRVVYLNVADGVLREGDVEHGGYSGVIAGIRTKDSAYNGKTVTKLEIKMVDPDQPDAAPVVISGTLYNSDGSVTTYARMLVARLIKKGNTGQGEHIDIGVYRGGETRATCAALRRHGEDTALQGADVSKDDPRKCRSVIERGVTWLIETYGTFGKGIPDRLDDEDRQAGDSAAEDTLIDTEEIERIEALGASIYGAAWPRERTKQCAAITQGGAVDLCELNHSEAGVLLARLRQTQSTAAQPAEAGHYSALYGGDAPPPDDVADYRTHDGGLDSAGDDLPF